jgi:hypothetical protein
MEADADGLFSDLNERITQQNAKLTLAKDRAAEQVNLCQVVCVCVCVCVVLVTSTHV